MITIDFKKLIRTYHLWYGFKYTKRRPWKIGMWVYYPTMNLIRPNLPKPWSRWILHKLRRHV